MTAYKALNEWLQPSQPLLLVRFCGTTPNSTSLGPLLKSICQQISYTFMLPFDDIPDDTVPVTAFLKVRLVFFFLYECNHLLIFSVMNQI